MNNPCQVGLKRIGMKMKLLYACQQVHRTWWMNHNFSLWNLCSFVHDPIPAASTLLPKNSNFTNFGPCCISSCLTQWLVVVNAQRFCRMSERQCLLWVILHLPPSLDQPHLDVVWDGRLSLTHPCSLLSSHLVLWTWWTCTGLRRVVQSWTPCLLTRHGIWGSDAQLSWCPLSCMMGSHLKSLGDDLLS